LADALKVYVGGGAGFYLLDGEATIGGATVDFDPSDEIGFYAVAGVELHLSEQAAIFGEAKYTWLQVDEVEIDGVKMDLDDEAKLDGVGANAGLLLLW